MTLDNLFASAAMQNETSVRHGSGTALRADRADARQADSYDRTLDRES